MNCPYYDHIANNRLTVKERKGKVCCIRGFNKTHFEGDTEIHLDKYCNGIYTRCVCYDILEKEGAIKK